MFADCNRLTRPLGALLIGLALAAPGRAFADLRSSKTIVRNPSAATGRAGSATLSARALIGKTGQTTLELTTGALDSAAPAPGYISQVQVKTYNRDGNVSWAQSSTPTGQSGSLSYSYDHLARAQSYQVQTNIRGIDGSRTNLVTVTGVVLARPDLEVVQVNAPSQVAVGNPVNIVATINEDNGDVGASASCVLSQDGVELDRANAVWVAKGDHADCAFTVEFDSAGTKSLSVSVQNVVPADWDNANNAKAFSLEVVNPTAVTGTLQASYSQGTSHYYQHVEFWYANSSTANGQYTADGVDYENTMLNDQAHSGAVFVVNSFDPWIAFPLQVNATLSLDGAPAHVINRSIPMDISIADPSFGSLQTGHLDDGNGETLDAILINFTPEVAEAYGIPSQHISGLAAQVQSSSTLFLSRLYQRQWYQVGDQVTDVFLYEDNQSNVGQTGTLMHAENTAQWDILVNSGTYQLSRSVPMTLGPVTGYDNPASPYCFDNSYSYNGTASTSHFCTVSESSSLGRLASAFQSF